MDKYRSGDYYVICDRCGRKRYRSECRFTWDKLLVCSDTCWEPKHPQLSVKAKADKIRVADPRPDSQEITKTTTLSSVASKDDKTVDVTSTSHLSQYDAIGVVLDEEPIEDSYIVHWTFAASISGTTVTLKEPMPGAAGSGNSVYVTGTGYLTTTEVASTSL